MRKRLGKLRRYKMTIPYKESQKNSTLEKYLEKDKEKPKEEKKEWKNQNMM